MIGDMRLLLVLLGCAIAAALPAAEDGLPRTAVFDQVREAAALGRRLFADPALSASGRLSCAGCHDPARAFGPPNARAVQLGGASRQEPGLRAVPSLRYLQAVPQFAEHYYDSGDESDP